MMDKYNYVLMFKDGEVPALPESKRRIEIHKSEQNWKCAIGSWDKEQIEGYNYYSFESNWREQSGWTDKLLC